MIPERCNTAPTAPCNSLTARNRELGFDLAPATGSLVVALASRYQPNAVALSPNEVVQWLVTATSDQLWHSIVSLEVVQQYACRDHCPVMPGCTDITVRPDKQSPSMHQRHAGEAEQTHKARWILPRSTSSDRRYSWDLLPTCITSPRS